jgi:hypothetical protein
MVSEFGCFPSLHVVILDGKRLTLIALVSLPASFILWLASPEARFLKGKFLWANWDVEELKARSKELESTTQLNVQVVGWPFGDTNWKPRWDN